MKFCQNFHFLIFVIFVAEISDDQFSKQDKILRIFLADNFLYLWQFWRYLDLRIAILGTEVALFQNATVICEWNNIKCPSLTSSTV